MIEEKMSVESFLQRFRILCHAIDNCLANTYEKFVDELKTLMTLNFHSFENLQFLAV